jgi:YesN/AraC family two-component response regulator
MFYGEVFLTVLFATKEFSRFSELVLKMWREQAPEFVTATSGATALLQLQDSEIDMVIADEQLDDMSGIALVKEVVKINPLVNTAIVSSFSADEFHEATEGLGVLMQLPMQPHETDAEALLDVLEKIGSLMQPNECSPQGDEKL